MYISLNWLNEYVDTSSVSPGELAHKLTLHTVEIEDIYRLAKPFEHMIVGKVLSMKKHPNADKLNIVTVDLGKEEREIVCGASNVREDMLVPIALSGARVKWHGEGELVTLEKAEIRGVMSDGMICAAAEIGLADGFKDEDGIMDITYTDAKPGTDLAGALGMNDVVIEVDNKAITHRPDLWGHYGIAREVAAFLKTDLKNYTAEKPEAVGRTPLAIKVDNFEACPRFMAVKIAGIAIGESPQWLKNRLIACGVRPVNNIVDITNYVMLEIGQPMHAYDYEHIEGDVLQARMAKNNEKVVTLDGKERTLSKEDIVITDQNKIVAIAGVMGAENSEVRESTTAIVLEAANFHPVMVRKTSTRLGLRSDASARFEKGLDPHLPEHALLRAIHMIMEMQPKANIESLIIDEKKFELNQGPIELSVKYVNKVTGLELKQEDVVTVLESLGFLVESGEGDLLIVRVPTWRATGDVSIPEDLVEEIARMYGYENIPAQMPKMSIAAARPNREKMLAREIGKMLSYGFGMSEVHNYSFVRPETLATLGIDGKKNIKLANALNTERDLMRQSLVPNMVETIGENLRFYPEFSLYEIGMVFQPEKKGLPLEPNSKKKLPVQYNSLCVAIVGGDTPFFQAKAALEAIMKKLNLPVEIRKGAVPVWGHPGRFAEIHLGKRQIGVLAELHPRKAKAFDIEKRVAILELHFSEIAAVQTEDFQVTPIPKFPYVQLDVSMTFDKKVAWEDIVALIQKNAGDMLKKVELFDEYTGKGIDENQRSLSFHIDYGSDEKTLTMEEVDAVHQEVIKALAKKLKGTLRE